MDGFGYGLVAQQAINGAENIAPEAKTPRGGPALWRNARRLDPGLPTQVGFFARLS